MNTFSNKVFILALGLLWGYIGIQVLQRYQLIMNAEIVMARASSNSEYLEVVSSAPLVRSNSQCALAYAVGWVPHSCRMVTADFSLTGYLPSQGADLFLEQGVEDEISLFDLRLPNQIVLLLRQKVGAQPTSGTGESFISFNASGVSSRKVKVDVVYVYADVSSALSANVFSQPTRVESISLTNQNGGQGYAKAGDTLVFTFKTTRPIILEGAASLRFGSSDEAFAPADPDLLTPQIVEKEQNTYQAFFKIPANMPKGEITFELWNIMDNNQMGPDEIYSVTTDGSGIVIK